MNGPLDREDQLSRDRLRRAGGRVPRIAWARARGPDVLRPARGRGVRPGAAGGIDLHVPLASLADADVAAEVRKLAGMLIDLQEAWFAWRGPASGSGSMAQGLGDPPGLGRGLADEEAGSPGRRFRDAVRPARGQRAGARGAGQPARCTRRPKETNDVIGEGHVIALAPTRRDFVQLAAVAGLLEPAQRQALWVQDHLPGGRLGAVGRARGARVSAGRARATRCAACRCPRATGRSSCNSWQTAPRRSCSARSSTGTRCTSSSKRWVPTW